MDTVVAYSGLDWADEWHSVHLQTAEGKVEHLELEQKPAVLHAWVAQLQQRFAGGKIAVALEQRKGAVIHALLMYDCFVLYPINPKALARYREAFRTSGARTIRSIPSCCWTWWSATATSCVRGCPTPSRVGSCRPCASSAGNW